MANIEYASRTHNSITVEITNYGNIGQIMYYQNGSLKSTTYNTLYTFTGLNSGTPYDFSAKIYSYDTGSWWWVSPDPLTVWTEDPPPNPTPPSDIWIDVDGKNIAVSFLKGDYADITQLDAYWISGYPDYNSTGYYMSFTVPNYNTSYQFRMRSYSYDSGTFSSWTYTYSFTSGSPPIPSTPSSPVVCDSRIEGGLGLSWGSSLYANYYRLYYTWDNGTQSAYKDIYNTSYTLTGLQYGKTYSFQVKGCNSVGSSSYTSIQNATTTPQTPSISVGTVTNNSINIMTGYISGNYDKIRIYRQDNGAYLECSANSYVTFSGLIPGQTYYFYAKTRFYINSTTLWSVNSSNTVNATVKNRPDKFYWDTPKISGQIFDVKATEWNRLIQNTKDMHIYKLGSYNPSLYPMTNVSSGQQFYADRFNECRYAIGSLNATGIYTKYPGDIVYANDINTLSTKLNEIT